MVDSMFKAGNASKFSKNQIRRLWATLNEIMDLFKGHQWLLSERGENETFYQFDGNT
jgi:hypothetical protein